jgi:hypothetical protein
MRGSGHQRGRVSGASDKADARVAASLRTSLKTEWCWYYACLVSDVDGSTEWQHRKQVYQRNAQGYEGYLDIRGAVVVTTSKAKLDITAFLCA